jgi:hypothetical protein
MGLTCIYLLTGWGCLLMVFGWEFGWRISYEKVYELSHVGPVVSLLGIALFTASMIYVPMAMVHHAVTGDGRAFFDFRFVLRLIHARLTAYSGLAALFLLCSVPLTVLQVVPLAPDFYGHQAELSDAEVYEAFRTYLFCCCLFLFPVLLLLRFVAARIYASALLQALRRGTITRAELHPTLTTWLERLQIMPTPQAAPTGILPAVGSLTRRIYAAAPYVVMVLCWLAMILLMYPKEFLVYHPIMGFLNHVLVQFPTLDLIPSALQSAG